MQNLRLDELLQKYTVGTASPEEVEELMTWYRVQSYQDAEFPDDEEKVGARMLSKLNNEIKPARKKAAFYLRWAAAAVIFFLSCGGIYFLFKNETSAPTQVAQNVPKKNDILPGSNKAILTLGGGKQIILSDAQNGELATQGNAVITKDAEGRIVYSNIDNSSNAGAMAITYNTVTTPIGGEYQVVLPDGSHVWLNAASSITYPSAFVGKERVVKLNGEAYFEVAKNAAMPFKVNVNDKHEVEVLGTHFNIEAYSDNNDIKSTLLEGSVKLTTKNKQLILQPGQTGVDDLKGSLTLKQANLEEVMAWKNGLFVFNDENIKDVMKKAARWYDMDVEYRGDILKKRLGGTVSRYKNITELLDDVSRTGAIHYTIEGKKVILTN